MHQQHRCDKVTATYYTHTYQTLFESGLKLNLKRDREGSCVICVWFYTQTNSGPCLHTLDVCFLRATHSLQETTTSIWFTKGHKVCNSTTVLQML